MNKDLKKAYDEWKEAEELYKKAKKEKEDAIKNYNDWLDNIPPEVSSLQEIRDQKLLFYIQKRDVETDFIMISMELDKNEKNYYSLRREIKRDNFIKFSTWILIFLSSLNIIQLIDKYFYVFVSLWQKISGC